MSEEKLVPVTIDIEWELYEWILKVCLADKITVDNLIRKALQLYIKERLDE